MAVLSENDRKAVWTELMRGMSTQREAVGCTKPDLRAAVDAVDAWIEANSAAYNAAIPQPARGVLTSKQKARLLYWVALKRLGVL